MRLGSSWLLQKIFDLLKKFGIGSLKVSRVHFYVIFRQKLAGKEHIYFFRVRRLAFIAGQTLKLFGLRLIMLGYLKLLD